MSKRDEQLPVGWPEGLPLPTREEAEEAARRIAEDIEEARRGRKGKLLRSDPEMLTTIITI